MSDKTTSHGLLTLKPRKTEAAAPIPRTLQQASKAGAIRLGLPTAEAIERYGKRKMRALRPHVVAGTCVKIGDTYEVDGATGLYLCGLGQSAFVDDGTLTREREVMEQVKALGLDKPARVADDPAFRQPPERESWVVKP